MCNKAIQMVMVRGEDYSDLLYELNMLNPWTTESDIEGTRVKISVSDNTVMLSDFKKTIVSVVVNNNQVVCVNPDSMNNRMMSMVLKSIGYYLYQYGLSCIYFEIGGEMNTRFLSCTLSIYPDNSRGLFIRKLGEI